MKEIGNILFLQPAGGSLNSSPPLGLGYVATYLKNKLPEINLKIVDLSVEETDLESLIDSFKPDIVGVTGTTTMAKDMRLLLERIRSHNSAIPIVLGGPHATALKSEIFYLPIDFAVIGEGEETLFELITNLNSGHDLSEVDGLIYRKQDGSIVANKPRALITNIDNIPKIDWSLFRMDEYVVRGVTVSSRGCPYNCIFCSQPFGRSWRAHSPEYVFDVVKELVDNYGLETVRFMDDNPLINKERFRRICKLIIDSGYHEKVKIELNTGTRMDIVDRELLMLLKQVGVRSIWFGLESAVPEVLKGMRKEISLKNIREAISLTRSVGLTMNAFITIGMPGDTYERSMETMKFVKRHKIDSTSARLATPFPGTDLFDWVEKNGRWINKDYEAWYWDRTRLAQPVSFDTEDFTKEERIKALNKWLGFGAFQQIRLTLHAWIIHGKFGVSWRTMNNPGIIMDLIRNILGIPRYQKKHAECARE